jgi:hypothetical protein
VIDHRQRLLLLGQVDADHRAITRQQLAQPLPPRVPPPVTPRHPAAAATLSHRTFSSSLRLGHQARTTAPGGRSYINHISAGHRPSALSYYYGRGFKTVADYTNNLPRRCRFSVGIDLPSDNSDACRMPPDGVPVACSIGR